MSGIGMWMFSKTAGIWSGMRRWATLVLLITEGLLLLSLNLWPERQDVVTMPMLAILLVMFALQRVPAVSPRVQR